MWNVHMGVLVCLREEGAGRETESGTCSSLSLAWSAWLRGLAVHELTLAALMDFRHGGR